MSVDPDQMPYSVASNLQLQKIVCSGLTAVVVRENMVKLRQLVAQKFNKNSAEGVIAPAGAKVTGATIRKRGY